MRPDDRAEHQQRAEEPGADAFPRLAVEVAKAPDVDGVPPEERAEDLGGKVGGRVRDPDEGEEDARRSE